jgi:hypothetical protein
MLIRLSAAEHEAIIASMPLCDEWCLATAPVAPEVAAGGADEDLTIAQRSRLIGRLLVAQEARRMKGQTPWFAFLGGA